MKHIVLDTNIFVQDFWLDGHAFTALLPNFKAVSDTLSIPEVVIDETISQYRKKIQEASDSLSKAHKRLKLYKKDLNSNSSINIESEVNKYNIALKNILDDYGVKVLNYPEVEHRIIANKAMNRLKPFKGKGEGYCDALIWQNIIDLLIDKNNEIVFITNNSKDFLQKDCLDSDLKSELKDRDINPEKIKLYKNLKEFVDTELLQHLEELNDLKDQINSGAFGFDNWLETLIFDELSPKTVADASIGLTDDCYISVSEVHDISNITALETRILDKGKKYIRLGATLGVGLEICAEYEEYLNSIILKDIFSEEGVVPYDFDCIQKGIEIKILFTLIVTNDDFENGDLEIYLYLGDMKNITFL